MVMNWKKKLRKSSLCAKKEKLKCEIYTCTNRARYLKLIVVDSFLFFWIRWGVRNLNSNKIGNQMFVC